MPQKKQIALSGESHDISDDAMTDSLRNLKADFFLHESQLTCPPHLPIFDNISDHATQPFMS